MGPSRLINSTYITSSLPGHVPRCPLEPLACWVGRLHKKDKRGGSLLENPGPRILPYPATSRRDALKERPGRAR